MTDATLSSDNLLRFRKNLLEKIQKQIMTIDDKIRDEKLQYVVDKEAAKTSAFLSEKLVIMNMLLVTKCFLLMKNE